MVRNAPWKKTCSIWLWTNLGSTYVLGFMKEIFFGGSLGYAPAVCWGSLGILEYVISTTNSPLFVGWDWKVKRAFRGGSDSGDSDSNRDWWKDFMLRWGCFLEGFFLKVWKRHISQSSWKAKEHEKQIGKTKPLFYSHSCAQRDFFLWAKYRCVFKMFCFILFGSRVFFEKQTSNDSPPRSVVLNNIRFPHPHHPQKKWKIIQYNIHLQISCVFHCQKRQWNFVSVVAVH